MLSMTATDATQAAGFLHHDGTRSRSITSAHICAPMDSGSVVPENGGYGSVSYDHRARRPRRSAYIDRDAVNICLVTSAADRC